MCHCDGTFEDHCSLKGKPTCSYILGKHVYSEFAGSQVSQRGRTKYHQKGRLVNETDIRSHNDIVLHSKCR
jgi:hypothetical protein